MANGTASPQESSSWVVVSDSDSSSNEDDAASREDMVIIENTRNVVLQHARVEGDEEASAMPVVRPSTSTSTQRPRGLSYEEVVNRPRSNPRTHTPTAMRYQSPTVRYQSPPLLPPSSAGSGGRSNFNSRLVINTTTVQEESDHPTRPGIVSTTRTHIHRPLFGANALRPITPIKNRPRPLLQKSEKQSAPGHRKFHRTTRGSFVNTAADIAKESGNVRAAVAFAAGQEDARKGLFQIPNEPLCYRSVFHSLIEKGSQESQAITDVKQRFRNGEVAKPTETKKRQTARHTNSTNITGRLLLKKLHPRLKNIILRTATCANQESTFLNVMDSFERLVVFCFRNGNGPSSSISVPDENDDIMTVLNRVLAAPPTVTITDVENGNETAQKTKIRLEFDDASSMNAHEFPNYSSSNGPFYRMLLHGVCQFHGLNVNSFAVPNQTSNADYKETRNSSQSRQKKGGKSSCIAVVVSGLVCLGDDLRLFDCACEEARAAQISSREGGSMAYRSDATLSTQCDETKV